MNNKIKIAMLLSLTSCLGIAQAEENAGAPTPKIDASGSFDGIVKVLASVPQMCDIQSNVLAEIDFGEYIGEATTIPVNINLNCKSNTKLTFSIENGTNPSSTATERRLPLTGKSGDVPNYLLYKITSDAVGANIIGTNANAYIINTGTVRANDTFGFKFYGHLNATQPAAVVGKYSEDLNATLDYE